VLIRDNGPVFDITDALRITTEIRTVLTEHGDAILNGEVELAVRSAVRSFKADDDRPIRKHPPRPAEKRPQHRGKF
jgi:hypothetical protein